MSGKSKHAFRLSGTFVMNLCIQFEDYKLVYRRLSTPTAQGKVQTNQTNALTTSLKLDHTTYTEDHPYNEGTSWFQPSNPLLFSICNHNNKFQYAEFNRAHFVMSPLYALLILRNYAQSKPLQSWSA